MEKVIFFDYNSVFSSRLRSLLEEKNISKQKLADEIGVSRQAISQYCDGSTVPNADKLLKIAEYFNVSLDYLVGKTEAKTDNKDVQFICDYTGLTDEAVNALHRLVHYLNVEREDLALTDEQYEKEINLIEYTLKFYNSLITSCNGIESTNSLSDYLFSTKNLIDELKIIISNNALSGINRCAVTDCILEKEKMNNVLYYQALDYMKKAVDDFCSLTVTEVFEDLKDTAKRMSDEDFYDFVSTVDKRESYKRIAVKIAELKMNSAIEKYSKLSREVKTNADNNEA